jgi:5-formyltetrahydrofolate cyclo-ligase
VKEEGDILAQKQALRARMRALRAGLAPDVRAAAATALAAHGLSFLAPPRRGAVISAFAPLQDELRIWPLLRRLASEGCRLALPVMQGRGKALLFRAWQAGDALEARAMGIAEPQRDKPVLVPDILIVPLLAFDPHGWRIGYGGGYYDCTLRALRAGRRISAVGVGYDQQAIDAVPHLDYDERLDWVLTPSGPRRCADA